MMKMMLMMKMKTLKIAIKQFAPSVILMERLHEERKLANTQYLRGIYLPGMHGKKVPILNKSFAAKTAPSEK